MNTVQMERQRPPSRPGSRHVERARECAQRSPMVHASHHGYVVPTSRSWRQPAPWAASTAAHVTVAMTHTVRNPGSPCAPADTIGILWCSRGCMSHLATHRGSRRSARSPLDRPASVTVFCRSRHDCGGASYRRRDRWPPRMTPRTTSLQPFSASSGDGSTSAPRMVQSKGAAQGLPAISSLPILAPISDTPASLTDARRSHRCSSRRSMPIFIPILLSRWCER